MTLRQKATEEKQGERRLWPEVWTKAAGFGKGGQNGGVVQAAVAKPVGARKRLALGDLLVLLHGVQQREARRQIAAISGSYYQDGDRTPLEALQRAAATIGAPPAAATLAALCDDRLYLAQMGTGHATILRDGALYCLAEGQIGAEIDFYRPIIIQAGDRLLLSNVALQSLFRGAALAELVADPTVDRLEEAMRREGNHNVSLLLAHMTDAPAGQQGLAPWQWMTWLSLGLVAVLQLVALLALRG